MRLRILALVVIVMAVACGKSAEQKQAEQAAEDLKKAATALGQAAGQAGTAGGDGKAVDPVAFQTLQTHLPRVSGWEMGDPEGRRMTMPVPFSQVEATYRKGDARIDTTIVDTGYAQQLIAPLSMMLATGYSREASDGYEKATTVAGNPAVEKWNKNSRTGLLIVLVGKRFLVTVDGRDVNDIKAVQDFASSINFGAIAAAK